ncbi:Annexin protein [Phytophthora cinnamomi]|nr:Annexin protein [Phytophthora cinnamomi]
MGGAESAEMDPKQQQKLAAAKKQPQQQQQVKKTVEGGVTTYTAAGKVPVADFEAVSEQKSGAKAPHEPETEPSDPSKAPAAGGEDVKTQVFRTEEPDGCVVVTTVKTTRRVATAPTGEPVTTVER